jgi:hypothetical protein
MYGLGLSTKQIKAHLKEIYNVEVSPELISRVTDEVKGLVEEWRNRPLEAFYLVIFFDSLRANIRDEEHVRKIGSGDTHGRSKIGCELKFLECGLSKMKVQSSGWVY